MRPAVAIEQLEKLQQEAAAQAFFVVPKGLDSWKAKVRSVLVGGLGKDNNIVKQFDDIRYTLGAWSSSTPRSAWDNARIGGAIMASELIDAAVFELRLATGDEPVDEHAYDADLWAHVKVHVEDQDWTKVASQTAIFVENRIRTWTGDPKDSSGNLLVGAKLYQQVFGDASAYRLGTQPGEHDGWRFLSMGFAQALRNVDTHRIQERDDAKRYALGVLGLGSLLLTQLRHEHEPILKPVP